MFASALPAKVNWVKAALQFKLSIKDLIECFRVYLAHSDSKEALWRNLSFPEGLSAGCHDQVQHVGVQDCFHSNGRRLLTAIL